MPIDAKRKLCDKKVLLVEDNQILRELGRDSLESIGVTVTTAKSGYEAIKLNEKNQYDLVLMDIQMPGICGHEALKRMQEQHSCPQVMALTAHSGYLNEKDLIDIGFHSVLTKPYTVNQCYESITKAFKS